MCRLILFDLRLMTRVRAMSSGAKASCPTRKRGIFHVRAGQITDGNWQPGRKEKLRNSHALGRLGHLTKPDLQCATRQ